MDEMEQFFAMGGYAGYVWPAFVVVLVVMALLWFSSVRSWRQSEDTLTALRNDRRHREGDAE